MNLTEAQAARLDKVLAEHRARSAKANEFKEELIAKHGPDYDQVVSKYEINKAEQAVIYEWYESLVPEIKALQGDKDPLNQDEPYYGAIGGGLSYRFTPTSLGDILVVRESTTGKELNVTETLKFHFFG